MQKRTNNIIWFMLLALFIGFITSWTHLQLNKYQDRRFLQYGELVKSEFIGCEGDFSTNLGKPTLIFIFDILIDNTWINSERIRYGYINKQNCAESQAISQEYKVFVIFDENKEFDTRVLPNNIVSDLKNRLIIKRGGLIVISCVTVSIYRFYRWLQ